VDKEESQGLSNIRFLLRAFSHRNYRLFFTGQGLSLIGTWMQQVAMGWLVYRITDSTFYLGLIGFTSQVPIFFFASLAGVYADRHNRRHILMITQLLSMLQSLALAVLTITGIVGIWHLVLLSTLLGTVNAFDMPARQSFVIDMVEQKEDLGNAIAFNSFMFNGARLIGPSIAGVVIAYAGEGACFLMNTISFLTVIMALLAMSIPAKEKIAEGKSLLKGLIEGYVYAWRKVPIRNILLHLCIMSFIGMPCTVLMPYFARDQLHGGPGTLGLLSSFSGLGALIGVLYLASRKATHGLYKVIAITSAVFGLGLMGFSFSITLILSMALVFFMGFGMIVQMASCNTILQTVVKEEIRGRVMSLYAMAIAGMVPFGSLIVGMLSSRIGPPQTLLICGSICVAASVSFLFRNRPGYST
jgi:MFS family permease